MRIVTTRRFAHPHTGETLEQFAARVVPELDDPTTTLLSWNLHLAVRRAPLGAPGNGSGGLLGTDLVYLDPPSA